MVWVWGINYGLRVSGQASTYTRSSPNSSQWRWMLTPDMTPPHDPTAISFPQPCLVETLFQHFFVAAAAGDKFAMLLSDKGEVFCWGQGEGGTLGMILLYYYLYYYYYY
jgi:alpha-tubulin suppressor-like RCC1 family protein